MESGNVYQMFSYPIQVKEEVDVSGETKSKETRDSNSSSSRIIVQGEIPAIKEECAIEPKEECDIEIKEEDIDSDYEYLEESAFCNGNKINEQICSDSVTSKEILLNITNRKKVGSNAGNINESRQVKEISTDLNIRDKKISDSSESEFSVSQIDLVCKKCKNPLTKIRKKIPKLKQPRYGKFFFCKQCCLSKRRKVENGKKTTEQTRRKIIRLHKRGFCYSYIAHLTKVAKGTVGRWITRFNKTNSVQPNPRSGRPRCTTSQQDQALFDAVKANPSFNIPTLLKQHGIKCSPETVRNRLRRMDCQRSEEGPHEVDMVRRVAFALEYEEKPTDFWNNVIFCDGLILNAHGNVENKLLSINKTRFDIHPKLGDQKKGSASAGLFGWIHAGGIGELVDFGAGRITASKYLEVLEEVLLPSVRVMVFPEPMQFYLAHPDCPFLHLNVVKTWFEDHPEIKLIILPQESPDLNPLAKIWKIIMRKIEHENPIPCSQKKTINIAEFVWEKLRVSLGQALAGETISSLPQRLKCVIEAGGLYVYSTQ